MIPVTAEIERLKNLPGWNPEAQALLNAAGLYQRIHELEAEVQRLKGGAPGAELGDMLESMEHYCPFLMSVKSGGWRAGASFRNGQGIERFVTDEAVRSPLAAVKQLKERLSEVMEKGGRL